jgi:transposase
MVAADARTAVTFSLSPGQHGDGPCGRELMRTIPAWVLSVPLIMDRAYEGDETRQLALDLNFPPVVPPKSGRVHPWSCDEILYRRRNEIERLFRRIKGFRRIFSRFEKLDVMFTAFIHFALITEALRPGVLD